MQISETAAMQGPDSMLGTKAEVLDFGWADEKPVSGRRAAKDKSKKKVKPGSFGKARSIKALKS